MLGDRTAVATIAVKDLESARKFYEGTLGLTKSSEDPGGIYYKSGNSNVYVYTSEFAGTNKATTASWGVGEDIESVVKELQANGVNFETYDIPGAEHEGVIHVLGQLKAAWFKDPDGNILNVVSEM